MMLYQHSRAMRCRPSELILCDDTTAAFILDRSAWIVGSFIENSVERFRMASISGSKKGESKTPDEYEVAEYRRAMVDGTAYLESNVRKMRLRSKGGRSKLRNAKDMVSGGFAKGTVLKQSLGGKIEVEG